MTTFITARCAGCRKHLRAGPGVTELLCPNCQMPNTFASAVDPSARLRCSSCKSLVNAPAGLARFPCPQCAVEIDVDGEDVNEVLLFADFFHFTRVTVIESECPIAKKTIPECLL